MNANKNHLKEEVTFKRHVLEGGGRVLEVTHLKEEVMT
jgi:hypothetical protein